MFTYDFIMNYGEGRDIGCTLLVNVDYPEHLQPLNRDVSFSPEKRIIDKVSKLVCTFYDKKNYVCQIGLLIKTNF